MAPLETYWLVLLTIAGTIILIFVVCLAIALFLDMISNIIERRVNKRRKRYDPPPPPPAPKHNSGPSDLYGGPR